MADLPDGVVTFLFTDVEGSTRMWEEEPDSMAVALRQHDEAIDESVTAHNGISVKPRGEGDSKFIVFRSAFDAVEGAAEIQRRLAGVDWQTPRPLRVRASLHTGMADLRLGDYYGSSVNRAARLRATAHGGQTVMSGSTWELVQDQLPDDVTVSDMGRHRLKDLTRPEHVYQINVKGLDNVFPPLLSLDAVANNLPEQLTDFIGRQVELTEAESLLGKSRLLTIMGPGGAGKTRLAIQVAADLISEYPDGVFFVGLADISSSEDIIQAVAESLGLGLSSDEDPQAQLLAYLANKRQLLLFDNFEHLSDGAPIISEILSAAPQVAVVATSRSKLNLTGETVLALGGLETAWDTPEMAVQTSGVQLFVDAAQRSQPRLSLQPDDLDSMAKILRLTGGMPLGLVLAAAWVDILPVSEIASEIAKSMDILQTDAGDVPDRQRSVRAVFEYTWELLSPEERKVFAALSVFRGGFTREAAQQVAGASLRDLAALASKSLVTPSPDTGRFGVHELLRQYAEGELQKGTEHREVLEAHAAYYRDVTGEAFALVHVSDETRMLAMIEGDIDNIRSAWRHCLATRDAIGARKLVPGLWTIYEIRGWVASGVELFGEALDAFDEDSQDEATAVSRALSSAARGWFLALLAQPQAGEELAAQAAETLRSTTDTEALLVALQCRLIGLAYSGQVEEWGAVADEGITLGEKLDSRLWTALMKQWRGGAALMAGDPGTAKGLFLEGMEVYQDLDEQWWMSGNLNHQAQAAMAEGRLEDAIDLFSQSAQNATNLGAKRIMQLSLTGLGDANSGAGNLEAAESAYIKSLATSEQMGLVREMLNLMTKIATVRAAVGRTREAVEMLATVLAEPMSAQRAVFETAPIAETASIALAGLQEKLDSEDFRAAKAAGTSRPYDVTVKELLDSHS
ncbi:MAG: adenylate/guanylate cyclase domain-containing protein [Acidimicrobiia bacterium]